MNIVQTELFPRYNGIWLSKNSFYYQFRKNLYSLVDIEIFIFNRFLSTNFLLLLPNLIEYVERCVQTIKMFIGYVPGDADVILKFV